MRIGEVEGKSGQQVRIVVQREGAAILAVIAAVVDDAHAHGEGKAIRIGHSVGIDGRSGDAVGHAFA